MASAEKDTREFEVVRVIHEESIILTLTLEEARTLKKVTQRAGGPREGRRGHMHAIGTALYPLVGFVDDDEVDVDGELNFRN